MLGYTADEMKNMNVAQWDAKWSAEELKERIPDQINTTAKHLVTLHRSQQSFSM
jgi:hypothetical protein